MANAVLIIEDEETLAKNIAAYLRRAGFDTVAAGDAESGIAQLDTFKPDVIVLDYSLPGIDGLEALRRIRAVDQHVKVIMITAHGNVRIAVDAMKASAFDYLAKPVVLSELRALIEKAVGEERREGALSYYQRRAGTGGLDAIVGESEPIRALKDTIRQLVRNEAGITGAPPPPVLITGETGTGKELIARAIHYEGARASRPFVEINCGSIPANLLESELFGYERGAFTDARERKIGLIESADGGTLFLDEIGDMELALQVKLLRVLEDQVIRRLGSVRDHSVNVRIVSATNRPLEELAAAGRFRPDLLFRLRIVALHSPLLRDRGSDLILLARHFITHFGARYGKPDLRLDRSAEDAILGYRWPGNVRELRNVIEQAALLSTGSTIEAPLLRLSSGFSGQSPPPGAAPAAPGPMSLENMEREMLRSALERTMWNVSRAAGLLGISRDTLRYRMAKFQLQRPGGDDPGSES